MNLRVGRIPFLVCAPFFHLFFREEAPFEGYSFDDGAPSALNQKLWTGEIHLAPASSIAYARAPQDLVLAPDLCTSCRLEVHSVELYSKYPLQELSDRRIYLTSQSGTSVALLRIICSQYVNVHPEYVTDRRNADAALLIGDEALVEKSKNAWPFCYDMAVLWRNWHGLPFVFGAWSIHKSALLSEVRPKLDAFLGQAHESVAAFRKDPAAALKKWGEHYPVPFTAEQLKDYYDSLDYEFTDERKESLKLYFNLCEKEGILNESPSLRFL